MTELLFEGAVVERRRPRVPAETSIIVTFTRDVGQKGEYTVRVNDVEVGTVTVQDGQVSDGAGANNEDPTGGNSDDSSLPLLWILGGLGALGGGGYLLKQNAEDDTNDRD